MRTMDFFETKNDYAFQRYFVKDLEDFLQSNYNVLFLMGPRKCGKTVALKQFSRRKGIFNSITGNTVVELFLFFKERSACNQV